MKKLYILLVAFFAVMFIFTANSYAAASVAKAKPAKPVKPVMKKTVVKVPALSTATIKAVQGKLKKMGLYKGKIDGMIGPLTTNAIKAFQKKKGLKVDGIIGPMTMKALGLKK